MPGPGVQQDHAGIDALGTASFEREFGGNLAPPRTLFADERVVRQQHIVEKDLSEMAVPRQILNRTDRHARSLEVDDQLRKTSMAIFGPPRCPDERNHIVASMCVCGPDFLAVEPPSVGASLGPRTDARKIRARTRLAHADAKDRFAAAYPRKVMRPLCLAAETEDQGRALPVGDPMRRDGGADGEQFLDDDEPGESAAPPAAIAFGQGQAEEAGRAQFTTECRVEPRPGSRAPIRWQRSRNALRNRPDGGTKRFIGIRNGRDGQVFEQ